MDNLYIIGSGGQSNVVEAVLKKQGTKFLNISKKYKTENDKEIDLKLKKIKSKIKIHIAIGNNKIRKKLFDFYNKKKYRFFSVIDKTSVCYSKVSLESNCFIGPLSILGPKVEIGKNCIINSLASVEHDTIIEDNVHIAPGSIILGGCKIQNGSFIGSKTVINPSINVGRKVIIGSGSVVTKNCMSNQIYRGSPAKIK